MSRQEKDTNRAAVMCIVWTLVFGMGCIFNNAVSWTIVLAATAVCAMYIKYDLERERKEKVRERIRDTFKAEMKEREANVEE